MDKSASPNIVIRIEVTKLGTLNLGLDPTDFCNDLVTWAQHAYPGMQITAELEKGPRDESG